MLPRMLRLTYVFRDVVIVERDPAIDAWMKEHSGELGAIAHQSFEVMRKCGDEVRELLHRVQIVARTGCKTRTEPAAIMAFESELSPAVLSFGERHLRETAANRRGEQQ